MRVYLLILHPTDVDALISGVLHTRENVPGERMVQDILQRAAGCVCMWQCVGDHEC